MWTVKETLAVIRVWNQWTGWNSWREERACFLSTGLHPQQYYCGKNAPCFQQFGFLMIVHSVSNQSYFAQCVHSGERK